MKRFLLDTHVLIWCLSDDVKLGTACRSVLSDTQNLVYVSAASTWEMSIKKGLGKLDFADDLVEFIELSGFSKLPISLSHGLFVEKLPQIHKDPFDRMLIAQAFEEQLILVTADQIITKYNIQTMDPNE